MNVGVGIGQMSFSDFFLTKEIGKNLETIVFLV